MSNVDPESMEMEEAVEAIKADPGVAQIRSQYISGKLAGAIAIKEAAEQAKNPPAPPALPVQPAVTGGGQVPPQGTGLPEGNRMIPPMSPKPAPGTVGGIQNQMRKMRRPQAINQQGQGGGGNNG
jgi:hypothetical protein